MKQNYKQMQCSNNALDFLDRENEKKGNLYTVWF